MAERECDLVMRGGITSGVVYPRAIAKLAETYRFRAIGGTSAGAIAAVVTAAAEYRRRNDGGDSFEGRIAGIPEEIGETVNGRSRLLGLFQPQREAEGLFRLLLASLRTPAWRHVLVALIRAFPLGFLIGALPGLIVLLTVGGALVPSLFGAVAALVLGILGTVAAAGVRAWRILPRYGFGMCSGMCSDKGGDASKALTPWLHELIQKCAGRDDDPPLTFGDLWAPGRVDGPVSDEDERAIELTLITTNVTQGLPHRFPFLERSALEPLYFRRDEFRALFPAELVDWMCQHPNRDPVEGPLIAVPEGTFRLPAPRDLPILLGARFSLSFPFLLSAVPLWTPDLPEVAGEPRPWRRCLFSDGGLTSNFPIHLFDAPIPGRPTFCINLKSAAVKVVENGLRESAEVWLPPAGEHTSMADFLHQDLRDPRAFFAALFDTSRNWADSELATMPGYRERIVSVHLDAAEGGMNLDMDPGVIRGLGDRGTTAGRLLADRFDPADGDRHLDAQRWARLRSTLAALELTLRSFTDRWCHGSYDDLLKNPPTSYPWRDADQGGHARAIVVKLNALAAEFDDLKRTMDARPDGASPRAKPILRMMPPGSRDPRIERFMGAPLP